MPRAACVWLISFLASGHIRAPSAERLPIDDLLPSSAAAEVGIPTFLGSDFPDEDDADGDIEIPTITESLSDKVACCCKPGACKADSKGVRGFPARDWTSAEGKPMCCKERWGHCDMLAFPYKTTEDSSKCLPKGGTGRTRICFSPIKKLHMSVELGDGGCTTLLEADGRFKRDSRQVYVDRDCPFSGTSEEDQVRRQLLLSFHEAKPASYADVMHTCNPAAGQLHDWPERHAQEQALDTTSSLWGFLREKEPLRQHLEAHTSPSDFVCRTLRLLPLLWTRVGMRSQGLTQDDDIHEPPYPRSRWGREYQAMNPRPFQCHRYVDLSAEETARTRRVLRALLPTWGVHVFAQSKWGQNKKGLLTLLGQYTPDPFHDQLIRECTRQDDAALVSEDFLSLQNGPVLMRDKGECKKRFPCAFLDKDCEATKTCKCTCFKSVCWTFPGDFLKAMQETFKIQQCQTAFHRKAAAAAAAAAAA